MTEKNAPISEADELYPGGPRFFHAPDVFRLSTDSVLLADFASVSHAKRILDLGCGGGTLGVLLALRAPDAEICGVEISESAAALCRRNFAENGLSDRCRVTQGDLRDYRALFEAGKYDLVVSNPPYFAPESGYLSPVKNRAAARDERMCSLAELCEAAKWLTRWGGLFALVHRPERMSEVLCAMSAAGIEPKRLRMVQYNASRAPSLFLAEGRRGGKPGLDILPPLLLTDESGGDSAEIRRIYHRR